MLIHLIRHSTPKVKSGICYGQADLDLESSFEVEKTQILNKLLSNYDYLITSPLIRCALLAEDISATKRVVDTRIMEYDFGEWELKPWADISGDAAESWMNDFVDIPAPGGESIRLMKSRVDEFFDELLTKNYQRVAVVTHSGVQRLLHARILGTPLKHMFRLQLDFGAIMEININRKNGLHTIKHL